MGAVYIMQIWTVPFEGGLMRRGEATISIYVDVFTQRIGGAGAVAKLTGCLPCGGILSHL